MEESMDISSHPLSVIVSLLYRTPFCFKHWMTCVITASLVEISIHHGTETRTNILQFFGSKIRPNRTLQIQVLSPSLIKNPGMVVWRAKLYCFRTLPPH